MDENLEITYRLLLFWEDIQVLLMKNDCTGEMYLDLLALQSQVGQLADKYKERFINHG